MARIPTVKMLDHHGKPAVVNAVDFLYYQQKYGWKRIGDVEGEQEGPRKVAPPPAAPPVKPVAVTTQEREAQLVKLNVPELRELAKKLEVESPTTLAKRELIDAVLAVEFQATEPPPEGETPEE